MDEIYPVGSIYISMDDKNPSSLFGGTWKVIGEGRTLVGNMEQRSNYEVPIFSSIDYITA